MFGRRGDQPVFIIKEIGGQRKISLVRAAEPANFSANFTVKKSIDGLIILFLK